MIFSFSAAQRCDDSSPCIRYCCAYDECPASDKIKNEYFSIEGQRGAINIKSDFKILKGKPPCEDVYKLYPNQDINDVWSFLSVSLE